MQPHYKVARFVGYNMALPRRNVIPFKINTLGENSNSFACPSIELAASYSIKIIHKPTILGEIINLYFVVTATIGTLSPA